MNLNAGKIGARIRKAREDKNWRQEDLAEKIGKTATYVGMIERGERLPRLETFLDIIIALEVSADFILCDVVQYGYKIRLSRYEEQIGNLMKPDRERLYNIIDAYLEDCE
ncbi:MAG: helix-turn-helix transcriptional regulator [Clostridiaceae bacterium]|nr:helix-turn-helix transcriptional regulator [Clostridiaceae bacterium]